MLRQCGIGARRHLRTQGGFVVGTDAARATGAGTCPTRAGLVALPAPPAKGGWVDVIHCGDVKHAMAVIHGGQGSLTDVVRGVRALHPPSLPDRHNFRYPL